MAKPKGELIELHPALVLKWAKRYIHLYRKEGSASAKKWALEFLPPGPRVKMIEKVKELLNKKKTQ